jgi:hypothetical protein
MNEKQFILKHANKEIIKLFCKELDKLWAIIDDGSFCFVKCNYCDKIIKDWAKARLKIDNIKIKLEKFNKNE